MSKELSRIKQKIKMFEIEGVHGLLSDVIEEVVEFADCKPITPAEKIFIVQKVKHKYHRFIKDNDILPPKQSKLFP